MSKNENINKPRLTITTKENGCPGCGFPRLACRCGSSSGDIKEPSQNLEPKENAKLSMLSIFKELKNQKIDVATQNKSAPNENGGIEAKNPFSIPRPYSLPKCTPS